MLCKWCAGVMVVSLALAQKPAESGSYEDLKPAQKRLVEDWLARVENVVGKSITPEALYDAVPVSVRTTFEAVTHALMTTKLTDESGQPAGTALNLVAKLDAVAGKAEGTGSDEQFRIYVQLKPEAYKTLLRTRQFVRSMDSTSYHRGFPICFRTPGIPSIQMSMSRDQMRGIS